MINNTSNVRRNNGLHIKSKLPDPKEKSFSITHALVLCIEVLEKFEIFAHYVSTQIPHKTALRNLKKRSGLQII